MTMLISYLDVLPETRELGNKVGRVPEMTTVDDVPH